MVEGGVIEEQVEANEKQYCDLNFYEMQKIQDNDVERCNFGLNKRILSNNSQLYYETDLIL